MTLGSLFPDNLEVVFGLFHIAVYIQYTCMYIVDDYKIDLHSLRTSPEKVLQSSLLGLFLKLARSNNIYIYRQYMYILYIYSVLEMVLTNKIAKLNKGLN